MKLSEDKINLILYMINYMKYEHEYFQIYMKTRFGKEYSEEEIKNMFNELKHDVNILRFK